MSLKFGIVLVYLINLVASLSSPHIIVFLVDDLGWNDVGYHGAKDILTPNIDALATDGVILSNYYVTPACSPSRAALLTGLYPSSTGMQHYVLGVAQPAGLPLHLKTLPQVLKTAGYDTRMLGKWHLGYFKAEYTPSYRGFDSHFGSWNGMTDYFFHTSATTTPRENTSNVPYYETRTRIPFQCIDFRDNLEAMTNRTGQYFTDIYTEKTLEIISTHNTDKPLFLYLAHHGVHRSNVQMEMRSPKKYTNGFSHIQDKTRRNFAGALKAVDYSLGKLVSALERRGMLNDTILIFSSDNGTPQPDSLTFNGGSSSPLRGAKLSGWEGAVKVPAFIWSTRLRRSRYVYKGLMHVSDWMPTIYRALGGNVKELGKLDGVDMWRSISNNLTSKRKDVLLLADPMWNVTAYRHGDHKLVSGNIPMGDLNGHYRFGDQDVAAEEESNFRSEVETTLERFHGKLLESFRKISPVKIDCGRIPTTTEFECDLRKEDCLFNVIEDPCEYKNIAKIYPQIVKTLWDKVKSHKICEPWFPDPDYKAHSMYHSGRCSPWL